MLFRVVTNNPKADKVTIKTKAPRYLLIYPKRTTEVTLDRYLKENYGQQLIPLCLKIIKVIKISEAPENTLVITIPNKELDTLAHLITYGNSEVAGSDILKVVLGSKYKKQIIKFNTRRKE